MPDDPLRKYFDDLAREGKVELVVTLRGHPDDEDFEKRPPACSVTISVRDPQDPDATFAPTTKQFSRDSDRTDRTFAVRAETVVGSFKRFFGKGKAHSLEIVLTVSPVGDWARYYEATSWTVTGSAGTSQPVEVYLKPRSTEARLLDPNKIDKPKYPPPLR